MSEKDLIHEVVKEVVSRVAGTTSGQELFSVPIGVSARHLHVSQAHLEELFGRGYTLKNFKDLTQPGQFAAEEQVTLVGPKGVLQKVRILGPCRSKTQVELSQTDAFGLGINNIPVRDSGDLENSPGITICGPNGAVVIKEGVVIAKRHIHLTSENAKQYNLADKDLVRVKIDTERAITLENVLIRVSDQYAMDFHLDFDEANACGAKTGMQGKVIK